LCSTEYFVHGYNPYYKDPYGRRPCAVRAFVCVSVADWIPVPVRPCASCSASSIATVQRVAACVARRLSDSMLRNDLGVFYPQPSKIWELKMGFSVKRKC